MFDITEKKREKLIMRRDDVPDSMDWGDTAPLERQLDDPKLCVRYDGMDLLPLETSVGVTFIQEKYLLPLDGLEYMRLYERRGRNGDLRYIVAKIGMMIQAVIMPMDFAGQGLHGGLTADEPVPRRYAEKGAHSEAGKRAGAGDGAAVPGG